MIGGNLFDGFHPNLSGGGVHGVAAFEDGEVAHHVEQDGGAQQSARQDFELPHQRIGVGASVFGAPRSEADIICRKGTQVRLLEFTIRPPEQ